MDYMDEKDINFYQSADNFLRIKNKIKELY